LLYAASWFRGMGLYVKDAKCKQETDAVAVVASRCVLPLVAVHTDNALVGRCKFLIADHLMTLVALETFRVPFSALVLEFLHACKQPTLTDLAD